MQPEAEIRVNPNDALGIPHHAYPQANGKVLLCKRKPELCRDCANYGVPVIPPDPFEAQCDLFRDHWHLPWQVRDFTGSAPQEANAITARRGVHIIAHDRATRRTAILAFFGEEMADLNALYALVHVHNEMIGR